jgi:glycosyltransferase involved in cell wall biosynthesis
MIADDVPGWVASIVDKIEASLVRKADLVIAVNKAHSAYLVPNAQDRLILVDNCVELPPWKEQAARMDGTVMLFYAGALEPLRYIQETIEAAEKVPGCTFKVAGFGRYEGWVKEKAATGKVVFLGYLPHDKMMDEMASSDAVLCLMDPSNVNNVIGTPNKLFEAMAVGVPLLTLKGTLSGEIVEKEGCGFAFEWSEDAFKRAIGDLKDVDRRKALGLAGRKAAEREYNWGIMKARLLEGYRRILTGQ